MKEKDTILVIADIRSKSIYMLLDAVEKSGVICRKEYYDITPEKVKEINPKGIILSGSPDHIYEEGATTLNPEIFNLGYPILGICYGFQVIVTAFGGTVALGEAFELAPFTAYLGTSKLFENIPKVDTVWMAHYDRAFVMPLDFKLTAKTDTVPIAGIENEEKGLYAVQWHPEEPHSLNGQTLIENFIFGICKASKGE